MSVPTSSTITLDTIDRAIHDLAAGRPVVVVDDEDRENEGDIVMAAAKATPEWVAFTIRHTSGILCVPLTLAEARRLNLTPMVADNDAPLSTAFTVSVDYREGLTTGISAEERCATIRALANHNAAPRDFVRPGHIFPLVAREGGVLIRTGHTEAAVDLARLAGFPPVGMIGELVNDDGTVKKGLQVADFARAHGLALVSIDDLIAYRQQRERLVSRVTESVVTTAIGSARTIVYATPFDTAQHVALIYGSIGPASRDVLVRLHREDTVADVFHPAASSVASALKRIQAAGAGVIVYLREGAVGVADHSIGGPSDLGGRAGSTAAAPAGARPAGRESTRAQHWREIGLGAQILRDLGLSTIRVLATRERQFKGLAGFGMEITGTERLD